jgi:hypothetical protein
MKLVLIDETTLDGLTSENLVSNGSIQPLENYFSDAKIEALANEIINPMVEGWEDGAKIYATGKMLAKFGTLLANLSLDVAIREVEEQGKNCELYGVKFEVRNTPPVFDFDADEVYKTLNESAKGRREQLTRAFKSKEALIDEETGEQIPKAVLKKPSGLTISVSFK